MKRFEYSLVSTTTRSFYVKAEIKEFLDKYGAEGWELVAIDYGCFIFKREVQE